MSSAPKSWRQKLSPPARPSGGGGCGCSVRGCCLAPKRIESRFSGRGKRGIAVAGQIQLEGHELILPQRLGLTIRPLVIKQARFSSVKRATFWRALRAPLANDIAPVATGLVVDRAQLSFGNLPKDRHFARSRGYYSRCVATLRKQWHRSKPASGTDTGFGGTSATRGPIHPS